ncbi:hypothetical protein Tco_1263703 [Tanacetum coccineum]
MLDKKELTLTLDNFITIFHLPPANDNNHNSFVPPPSFSDMVPFYKQQLGFTMELNTSSSFKTTGLLQPWQTLCKIFSKCLTIHYAELLWEGIYYSLHHPTSSIPYPRFTKIIDVCRSVWLDAPPTQSQPTESTQGTHRTSSAPRSPTPKKDIAESSAPKQSTVIHFCLPERRSTRLTPPVLVPTVEKADEMILQDTLQVSLAEHKSREEQEARENVELVNKHLASEEIEKLVEGSENVIDDSLPPRNDEPQIPDTRLEPQSDKESPEVERTNDEEVEVTNVVIPVNVNEEEDEITDEVYELKRREKGKIVEESRSTPLPTPIRSPRTHTNLVSLDTEKLQELTETHTQTTSSSRSQHKLSRANRLLSLFKAKPARFKRYKNFFQELQGRQKTKEEMEQMIAKAILQERGNIQAEISSQIQKAIDNQIPSQVDASNDPHDDAHPVGENSVKRQKTYAYEAYVSGESSSGQVNEEEQDDDEIPSKQVSQDIMEEVSLTIDEAKLKKMADEMLTQRCTSDDDEIPMKQVSQDIMEEVSLTIDEAKLKKMADEMLRQRCTSGDEHQYHIDQMKNFLQSDIVWESRKEILVSPHPQKTTPLVQSCQRDPEAPALSLINQDLLTNFQIETGLLWSLSVFIRSSVIWERVHDFQLGIESYQQKVNLTTPTMSFPGVEKHIMFSIIYEPVHRIIYKNSKKEKRVMRHLEIHKELTNDEVEYLKLFEEDIEVRLKHHNQMRRL